MLQKRSRASLSGVFVLAASLLLCGCPRKAATVVVTEQDALAANRAAQEGDLAFGRKDYYASLIKYLESVRLNPNNSYVFNRLGIAWSQLKYYDQAAQSFKRAMELNPKYSFSYNNLGTVHFATKDLKKAEKYFKKAISLKNDEASFHMNLGSLYLERKKSEKALAEWRKGMAIDPNILSKSNSVAMVGGTTSSVERHFFIARLLAAEGKVEGAIESLKAAIAGGFEDIDSISIQYEKISGLSLFWKTAP